MEPSNHLSHAGAKEVTGQEADVFICSGTLRGGKIAAKPKKLHVAGMAEQPTVRQRSEGLASEPDDVSLRTLDIFSGMIWCS
jgi:hypothetical protein